MEGLLKANAGAAVQLAHDDALGAVYNEAAALGHHVDVAHEYALFLRAVFLPQAESDVQGDRVGRALLYALYFAHLRPHEVVGDVFELVLAVVAFYRENFAEHRVKADLPALRRRDVHLKEIHIGIELVLN